MPKHTVYRYINDNYSQIYQLVNKGLPYIIENKNHSSLGIQGIEGIDRGCQRKGGDSVRDVTR